MNSGRRYVWGGSASGEGGPILIADLEDYLFWGGAEQRWDEGSVYLLHSYGPLVRRLPPRFQPQGPEEWHQNARIPTLTAAKARLRELIDAVMALEPTARLRDQIAMSPEELLSKSRAAFEAPVAADAPARQEWLRAWRDHLEQGIDFSVGGERIFHVDLKPDNYYARGCDALNGAAARISFGAASQGVLWDMEGGGVTDVALAEDRAGFLLLRTWVNEEKDQATARDFVEKTPPEEHTVEAAFGSGSVVVVWSPVQPTDHVEGQDPGPCLRAAARNASSVRLDQPGMSGVGTLFNVRPGDYRVFCGRHEAEEWMCRWARFVRK